jgi:predicted glycosyltransferase
MASENGTSAKQRHERLTILFDINHPADVHQFRFVMRELSKKHRIIVTARDKECVYELLKRFKIRFIPRKGYAGAIRKIMGIFMIDAKLLNIARRNKADILVGSSGDLYVAHAAFLLRKPSVIFDDTEHSRFQNMLTFPFATKIVTPDSYSLDLGKKQVRYAGSKEDAYLSPGYFKPSKEAKSFVERAKRAQGKKRAIFLRLVSWDASHDIGKGGIRDHEKLIDALSKLGALMISAEDAGMVPPRLRDMLIPHCFAYMHDLMHYSDLVVSEGGTTAVEAAILGTRTIYSNELELGYLNRHIESGMIEQITDDRKMIARAKELLKLSEKDKGVRTRKKGRKASGSGGPGFDLNRFMVDEILSAAR